MIIDDWLIQIDETLSLIKIIKIIVLWKDSSNTTNIIMLRIDIIISMFEKVWNIIIIVIIITLIIMIKNITITM